MGSVAPSRRTIDAMQWVMGRLGPIFAALALVATIVCAWTYAGPYRWIAEAQLAMPGASYDVSFTFAVAYIVWLIPGVALMFPLQRVARARGMRELSSADDPARFERWMVEHRGSFTLGLVTVGCLGAGGWFAIDAMTSGPHTEVDVGDLEAGDAPSSRHVTLTGTLRPDLAYAITEYDGRRYFTPIVRGSAAPVVFLETRDDPPIVARDDRYDGVLHEGGLPGMVREAFADRGQLGPRHYTLDAGRSPDELWTIAGMFAAMGALGALALVGATLWARRRRKPAR